MSVGGCVVLRGAHAQKIRRDGVLSRTFDVGKESRRQANKGLEQLVNGRKTYNNYCIRYVKRQWNEWGAVA